MATALFISCRRCRSTESTMFECAALPFAVDNLRALIEGNPQALKQHEAFLAMRCPLPVVEAEPVVVSSKPAVAGKKLKAREPTLENHDVVEPSATPGISLTAATSLSLICPCSRADYDLQFALGAVVSIGSGWFRPIADAGERTRYTSDKSKKLTWATMRGLQPTRLYKYTIHLARQHPELPVLSCGFLNSHLRRLGMCYTVCLSPHDCK